MTVWPPGPPAVGEQLGVSIFIQGRRWKCRVCAQMEGPGRNGLGTPSRVSVEGSFCYGTKNMTQFSSNINTAGTRENANYQKAEARRR